MKIGGWLIMPALKLEELDSVYKRFSLKGKKAMVTGAGGGIGRSTANALAEMGADVALVDIPQKIDVLKAYAGFIAQKHGIKTLALTGDVTDSKSVDSFLNEAVEAFGTLDVLHNNAGISGVVAGRNGSDISLADWEEIIRINQTGVLMVGRAAANVMKAHEHGGSVINTASMSAHIINRRQPNERYGPGYSATKAAVVHMTKAMAMDYVPYKIRFNSISPGVILSGMHDNWRPEILAEAAKMVPMQRFGTLDEVVGIVCYLASDLSTYTTGADFIVDGGYTVW